VYSGAGSVSDRALPLLLPTVPIPTFRLLDSPLDLPLPALPDFCLPKI
jgi:hypothetical protein